MFIIAYPVDEGFLRNPLLPLVERDAKFRQLHDVPPAVFASKAIEIKPDVVGLSGLITASFDAMKATVAALRVQAQEQRCAFPIVIGGGMIDEQVCRYVGADYWVSNAMDGVRLCQRLIA